MLNISCPCSKLNSAVYLFELECFSFAVLSGACIRVIEEMRFVAVETTTVTEDQTNAPLILVNDTL